MSEYKQIAQSNSTIFSIVLDEENNEYYLENEFNQRYWIGEMQDMIDLHCLLDAAIYQHGETACFRS